MSNPRWPNLDPRRRCMKPALWPALDFARWEAAKSAGGVLDSGGPASKWRPATIGNAEHHYGRYLTSLAGGGFLDVDAAPAARVTPEHVARYIEELRALNAPTTVFKRVSGLLDMMRVLEPGLDFRWLDAISRKLEAMAAPSRNKAALVVPTGELVDLGFLVMDRAKRGRTPIERAARRQHGLMIALLAFVPARRRNFTSIRVGHHLMKIGDVYKLRFPGEEMKNHQPFEAPVPEFLTTALDHHLAAGRPLLAARSGTTRARRRPAGDALWLSRFGSSLSANRIYEAIRVTTRAHFGHAINLHLFRDCGATTLADDAPAHVGVIRSILAHGGDAAARDYNQARGMEAARKFQEAVLVRRRAATVTQAGNPPHRGARPPRRPKQ